MSLDLLKLYQATGQTPAMDPKQINVLVLERLVRALQAQKDTSIKKTVRVDELRVADDLCEALKQFMRSDMPQEEKQILVRIFSRIQANIKSAINGETVDFGEATNAINFLVKCIKE